MSQLKRSHRVFRLFRYCHHGAHSPPYDGRSSLSDNMNQRTDNASQDHPLAQAYDGVELAGRLPVPPVPNVIAPIRFAAPPPPPLPLPPLATASVQHIAHPSPESPTRTLDEYVDQFLLKSHGEDAQNVGLTRTKLEPIPSNLSDLDCLRLLVARRAYSEAVLVSHRLLRGSHSHYAPIFQALLKDDHNHSLALESQQQELVEIMLHHLQALLKLQRYEELQKEIEAWTFVHSSDSQRSCPDWLPWSVHIAVVTCRQYTSDDLNSNESLDALCKIRSKISKGSDHGASLVQVDQAICNVFCRRMQWRLALASLQNIAENIPAMCQDKDDRATLEAAYACEVLSRQGRILLQAGATAQAASIFHQAKALWSSVPSDSPSPHQAIALVHIQLAINDGLVAFADNNHEHALECFRRAVYQLKPLVQEYTASHARGVVNAAWGLEMESPLALYSDCLNNMALCAMYTVRYVVL
jgi:tetratricopeptide (TPR) repeat protein